MKELIDIFRMTEISIPTRIKIIIQLGVAINDTHGMNITEGLVYELVKALDPFNQQVENEHYKKHIKSL
jgi:hypothetical protein